MENIHKARLCWSYSGLWPVAVFGISTDELLGSAGRELVGYIIEKERYIMHM